MNSLRRMLRDTPYSTVELLNAVTSMHNVMRYGHTSDFSFFFSSETSERNDYVHGILMVFQILAVAGLIWFFMLIVLRLLGKRVGCANGQSATIPAEAMKDNNYGDAATEDSGEFIVMQSDQNRINRIRIVFFVCGLCALVAAIFVVVSIVKVQVSFNEFYDNVAGIQNLIKDMPQDLIELDTTAAEFDTAKNSLASSLVGFCPSSSDISETASNLYQTIMEIDDISSKSNDNWNVFSSTIDDIEELVTDAVDSLDFAEEPASAWFICSMAFVFLSILGTIFFLILAWKSGNAGFEFVGEVEWTRKHLLTRFVAAPLYILLALLTWFAAGAAFAGATSNADFCHDEITTGHGVHKILEQRGFDSSSETYKVVDGYLHNCSIPDSVPYGMIDEYVSNITYAISLTDGFMNQLEDVDLCSSSDDTEYVLVLATNATEHLNTLQNELLDMKSDVSCEAIAPLVQKSVYELGCGSVFKSIMWAWVSLLGFATWCTLIVTLRTATHRPQIYIVPPNEDIDPIDSYDNSYDGSRVSKHVSRDQFTDRNRSRLSVNNSTLSRDVTVYS